MDEKRIYLIAQLDKASNERLSAIYDRLIAVGLIGEQTKGIPYHITLGSFDLSEQARVIERTQDLCRKTKTFAINLSHIAMFGLKVLFIAPAVNIELLKLHSELIPDQTVSGYHHWVAHTTLLIDSPDSIKTAIPIVAQAFTPFEATVQSVGVLKFPPARLITTFDLSS